MNWNWKTCNKELKKLKNRIIDMSNKEIYRIIKKLHEEENPHVGVITGSINLYSIIGFCFHLEHIYKNVNLNEKDKKILGDYLSDDNKERIERVESYRKFRKFVSYEETKKRWGI